ncbi:MAG: cupredoxin domain-containing protein [bacterium]
MTWRGWIAIVAATGISFTMYLTVLSAAGLGDFSGGGAVVTTVPPAQPEATAPASGGGLVVVAKDIKFSPEQLVAQAGKATITLKNEDGTLHNVHVFKGADNKGESLGATQPQSGPSTSGLDLTLEPGSYFYQCDIHPSQMHGTLKVTAANAAGQ